MYDRSFLKELQSKCSYFYRVFCIRRTPSLAFSVSREDSDRSGLLGKAQQIDVVGLPKSLDTMESSAVLNASTPHL